MFKAQGPKLQTCGGYEEEYAANLSTLLRAEFSARGLRWVAGPGRLERLGLGSATQGGAASGRGDRNLMLGSAVINAGGGRGGALGIASGKRGPACADSPGGRGCEGERSPEEGLRSPLGGFVRVGAGKLHPTACCRGRWRVGGGLEVSKCFRGLGFGNPQGVVGE